MTTPQDQPTRRIGDADRDAAVRRLQDAYAEGLLTHEEMDERVGLALAAATRGELASALDALPDEVPEAPSTIAAYGGRIERRGAWRVPRHVKVESAFGRVRLDLSRAVIEHPVVHIELHLGTGRAKITVPRDAVVDVEGLNTGWKDSRYTPRARPGPAGPTIRITGTMGFGRLKIRHARR
ncbi:DUF1707 SHOCT-like domain-containing protein [Streptomyces avicenniae]|uniref:DUF1707 SHOCT-like domain-containing protein n=1 Tax=Streptomyces avicenniae TaxID=500153 RepID=UPI00069B26FD|nr:DUF1707 domain-containing protein [Streptomyces avicenniae]